ncbi:uncharacterized protein BT62DRAFT_1074598 [Guyanagaster necrorhizus]|uniref:Uncharacterized protein n=1 Tax=Guyanagaster necrorhizus TaxID=856835 RepID=A0A9P8AUB1_9AGAR|nr:uncharacterized protein BT62DRAFT_1074598 [Guyanagaster necrorhizus MCA 3950]KAG7448085.1 hypothetical protein BT62DRAFT_1074598 [Guyanagaster necrorhizus MCA 3950]
MSKKRALTTRRKMCLFQWKMLRKLCDYAIVLAKRNGLCGSVRLRFVSLVATNRRLLTQGTTDGTFELDDDLRATRHVVPFNPLLRNDATRAWGAILPTLLNLVEDARGKVLRKKFKSHFPNQVKHPIQSRQSSRCGHPGQDNSMNQQPFPVLIPLVRYDKPEVIQLLDVDAEGPIVISDSDDDEPQMGKSKMDCIDVDGTESCDKGERTILIDDD